MNDELIDICINFIEEKDFNYLAKEGQIVHFMSTTGRKSDYLWHKYTTVEILRILRAMKLSGDQAASLREQHLISAFQELDRVFEFGMKSRHKLAKGIFNYSANSEMSIGDEAMMMLVDILQRKGFLGLIMNEVVNLFNELVIKLKIKISPSEQRSLMYKHFESAGFIMKTGANRPLINKKKQPAIIYSGAKPSDVENIVDRSEIISKIYRELS